MNKARDELMKQWWPSAMTDKELASRLGIHRSVMHRRAVELNMPMRRVARALMFHQTNVPDVLSNYQPTSRRGEGR